MSDQLPNPWLVLGLDAADETPHDDVYAARASKHHLSEVDGAPFTLEQVNSASFALTHSRTRDRPHVKVPGLKDAYRSKGRPITTSFTLPPPPELDELDAAQVAAVRRLLMAKVLRRIASKCLEVADPLQLAPYAIAPSEEPNP